jgi:hypothetical protein
MTFYDHERDGPLDPSPQAAAEPAFTHVFAIGVGRYAYMTGGHGGRVVADAFNLGQLASSPAALRQFVLWLRDEFRHPRAPLGSIELLASPEIPLPLMGPPDNMAATLENVQESFRRWFARCHTNPGNMAVFYFCGHGVMTASGLALLLEDFGEFPNPFVHTIDFDQLYRVMGGCSAETQLYFVDSCRERIPEASNFSHNSGLSLGLPKLNMHDAPIFYAAPPGGRAYGTASCTRFTHALLACLRGRGARRYPETRDWMLTASGLSEALPVVMSDFAPPAQTPRIEGTHSGRIIIHVLPRPPEIEVCISCTPEAAHRSARFKMAAVSAPTDIRYISEAGQGSWTVRAEAGHYIASVESAAGEFATRCCELWVDPPGPISACIEVQRQDAKGR